MNFAGLAVLATTVVGATLLGVSRSDEGLADSGPLANTSSETSTPSTPSAWDRVGQLPGDLSSLSVNRTYFVVIDLLGEWQPLPNVGALEIRKAVHACQVAITDSAGVIRVVSAPQGTVAIRSLSTMELHFDGFTFVPGAVRSPVSVGQDPVEHCVNDTNILVTTTSGKCWSAGVQNPASGCREKKCDQSQSCNLSITFTVASGLSDYTASGSCDGNPIEVLAFCSTNTCWNFGPVPQ